MAATSLGVQVGGGGARVIGAELVGGERRAVAKNSTGTRGGFVRAVISGGVAWSAEGNVRVGPVYNYEDRCSYFSSFSMSSFSSYLSG